ncbi:MAG: hypothetical protein EON59_17005 [Alphaproteobacteria bacterium]|nr:MAG: hypothetical protein EON59_17005 [Alphaproteobacteria bacterium]
MGRFYTQRMPVEDEKVVNARPVPISHSEIIDRKGGPAKVGRAVEEVANKVKRWKRVDSIPSSYWRKFVAFGLATYEELAVAAELRGLTVKAAGAARRADFAQAT